jgi:HK97 family phage portal protein
MGWLNDATAAVWNLGGALRPRANQPGPTDDFWYSAIGTGVSQAGIRVTPDIALKASAVYACIKILSETIASLPLQMFRELPDEQGRIAAPDHPLDELIRYQPNNWQTAVEFWEMVILHAALRGGGYAEIIPGPRGPVDQLIPIHTDRVTVEKVDNPLNPLRFRVQNPHTGQVRILLQEEMFRIPGLTSDGVTGLRAVDLAADAIGLGMAADTYAGKMFANRLNVGGFLKHPGKLSPDGQKNLINTFMERMSGAENAHRPMVLQEGMDFIKAGLDSREAQLLEARKWQIAEVARFWRIPLHMLNIDDQTNRSTVEAQAHDFVKYTLRPWVRRIEQAIRRDLITNKQSFSAKFNMDALLRGDSAARAAYFSAALGSGGSPAWMKVNEVRKLEGLNPDEDASANMLPVGTNPSNEPSEPAEDDTLDARAGRLVRKEITAIRKAWMRFADKPQAFDDWTKAFYGGHRSAVMEALDVPKHIAAVYCNYQLKALGDSDDLDATLEQWEDTLAAQLVETIERASRKALAAE